MKKVSEEDIIQGIKRLGIKGKNVIVHASLKSFGHVDGGANTVLDALVSSFDTVMMPAFTWESNYAPPEDERPDRNGCNYSFYDNWPPEKKPFIVEKAGIEKSMGIISKTFLSRPEAIRSDHPWHSWAAIGPLAKELTADHPWTTTNLPVERMAKHDGQVLLLGVGLESCTAIHVSEELAGRHSFYRWMVHRDMSVRSVRAAGCAKGFGQLFSSCADLFRETKIGNCKALAAPLTPLINRCAKIIKDNPEITRCSPECIRCRDSILGGPD